MTDELPGLTVIVLNFRDVESTLGCLESLEAAEYDGRLDVLVVENGSADGSRERLEEHARRAKRRTRIIASDRNLGFAGGHDLGWPHVETAFVCLLNNDAAVRPDCLRRLVETLRARPDLGAVWPYDAPPDWRETLRLPDPGDVAALRNGTYSVTGANIWLPLLKDYRECFAASGVCVVLRYSRSEVPFPAEYFMYYEDVYLGWRLRLRALASERVPEAVIYHEGSAVSRRVRALRPMFVFHSEKNRLTNLLLFYEMWTLLRIAPLLLVDEVKRCVRALIGTLRPDGVALLAAQTRARLWLATHLGHIVSARRAMQQGRLVRDRDLLPLLSGRLTAEPGPVARLLNALSLGYCGLVGLAVCDAPGHARTPMP